MNTYIFGYGSLINDTSRKKTAPYSTVVDRQAVLHGFRRKTNAFYGDYVYMNVVPEQGNDIVGTIACFSESELACLKEREREYTMTDITDLLEKDYGQKVYTFIAPDNDYPGIQVTQTYLDTCTAMMSEQEKTVWINETVIPYGIYDDRVNSTYEFAA